MISIPIWVFVVIVIITTFILGFVIWYEVSELIDRYVDKKKKEAIEGLNASLNKDESIDDK